MPDFRSASLAELSRTRGWPRRIRPFQSNTRRCRYRDFRTRDPPESHAGILRSRRRAVPENYTSIPGRYTLRLSDDFRWIACTDSPLPQLRPSSDAHKPVEKSSTHLSYLRRGLRLELKNLEYPCHVAEKGPSFVLSE